MPGSVEALIVELHCIVQSFGAAIMKIWSAGGQAAQDWSFGLADIGALARDHRATGIGSVLDFASIAGDRINRESAGVQSRHRGIVGNADVDRQRHRMIADVR